METTLRGVGVSHGVAIGEVRHMGTAVLEPPAKRIPAEEAEREQGVLARPLTLLRPTSMPEAIWPAARRRRCSRRRP